MDFSEILDIRMEEIASACTQCGKCFEACPMTEPAGIGNVDPKFALSGIVELLRGGDGNEAATTWAAACSSSGSCIKACDYGLNPRLMVRLAHFAMTRGLAGAETKANAMKSFRGMAKTVRIVSRLQLDKEVLDQLQPLPAKERPESAPDIVMYTGCNIHKTPHILILCLEVIRTMGFTYQVVGGPSACCGIFQFLSGDAEMSGRAGFSALRQIDQTGASEKLAWCPSCKSQFNEIIIPNYERMTNDHSFSLTFFFVWLAQHLDMLKKHFLITVNKRVALNERPGFPEVMDAVKRILAEIPGIELIELDVPRVGLMSNYLTVAPRFKDDLREREFKAAADAGITTLATVFHACHRELCHFERDISFEIVNVMEIIGESMGIRADDIYKRLKMMDNIDAMLNDCMDLIARHGLDLNEVRDTLLADQLAVRPLQGKYVEA